MIYQRAFLFFILAVICYLRRDKKNRRRKSFTKQDISGPSQLQVPEDLETRGIMRGVGENSINTAAEQIEEQHHTRQVELSARNDESINITCEMLNGKAGGGGNAQGNVSGTDNNDDVPLLTPTETKNWKRKAKINTPT